MGTSHTPFFSNWVVVGNRCRKARARGGDLLWWPIIRNYDWDTLHERVRESRLLKTATGNYSFGGMATRYLAHSDKAGPDQPGSSLCWSQAYYRRFASPRLALSQDEMMAYVFVRWVFSCSLGLHCEYIARLFPLSIKVNQAVCLLSTSLTAVHTST